MADICLPERQFGGMSERSNRNSVGGSLSFWTLWGSVDWTIEKQNTSQLSQGPSQEPCVAQRELYSLTCNYWHADISGPQFPHPHNGHDKNRSYHLWSLWALHGVKPVTKADLHTRWRVLGFLWVSKCFHLLWTVPLTQRSCISNASLFLCKLLMSSALC